MTWSIEMNGHDDLKDELKESFENGLVTKVRDLVAELKAGAGVNVTRAQVTTNTTGSVNALEDEPEAEAAENGEEEA